MTRGVAGPAPRDRPTSSRSSRSSAAATRRTRACGLPYFVAGEIDDVDDARSRASPEEHRANGIDVRIAPRGRRDRPRRAHGHRARPRVDGARRVEPFDQLVIATGATPIRPRPARRRRARRARRPDARRRHRRCATHVGDDRRRAAPSSSAAATSASRWPRRCTTAGLTVTIVEAAPQPMSTLDPDMGALVADAIRGVGIELRTDTEVDGFETDADGHVRGGRHRATGRCPPTSSCSASACARTSSSRATPASTIGATRRHRDRPPAGDERGRGVGRGRLRRDVPPRVAAGRSRSRSARTRTSRAASSAINATGGDADVPGRHRHRGHEDLRRTRSAAPVSPSARRRDAGFDVRDRDDRGHDARGLLPGRRADHGQGASPSGARGRLLGAQIVGREGAAKRIDVMATAIWNEMTADEFGQLDLGYAPPFSPLWDPTLIAARKAASRARGLSAQRRGRACALFLEVVLVHHLHELLEADLRASSRASPAPSTRRRSAG